MQKSCRERTLSLLGRTMSGVVYMELKCLVYPGWQPRIRPAQAKRQWMDEAPEAFPYRCLPLSIANSHGWEILSTCAFEAVWNGGMAPEDVVIRADAGSTAEETPQALFGQGTFTIHIQGLFRTPPGWDIYVSGSPNSFKDGATPLAGIIETDWSPYSFTINWRLTRPNYPVRFEENEPVAHFFPIQRGAVEQFKPSFVPIDDDPNFKEMFEQWSRSRDAFQVHVREHPPEKPADKWQKLYYRGLNPDGNCPVTDHQSKLRVSEFAHPELAGQATEAMRKPVVIKSPQSLAVAESARRVITAASNANGCSRRKSSSARLSAVASNIPRCQDLTSEQFLDLFYAPSRPVILSRRGRRNGRPASYGIPSTCRKRLAIRSSNTRAAEHQTRTLSATRTRTGSRSRSMSLLIDWEGVRK